MIIKINPYNKYIKISIIVLCHIITDCAYAACNNDKNSPESAMPLINSGVIHPLKTEETSMRTVVHFLELHETTSRLSLIPIAQEMLKRAIDPRIDLRLTKYPEHPCPPIYEVTFRNGQKMLILGTTHTVPLGCMLTYRIAHDIINASDFVINEICGKLLPGLTSEISEENHDVEEDENLTPYMTERRMQKIQKYVREFYLSETLKQYYLNSDDSINEEKLQKDVNTQMSKIFDSNNFWYENAGIIVTDDNVEADFGSTKDWPASYPKKLKIKGKIAIVPSRNGKELHPIALEFLHESFTGDTSYTRPICGGMDDHLHYMTSSCGKTLYAFEESADRYNESCAQELIETIDKNCENGFYAFKNRIESLQTHPDEAKQKSKQVTFESAMGYGNFYSNELIKDNSLNLLERNNIWIQRIMALNQRVFKSAFAYVGKGHLHDLFEKLTKLGFTVSERLSLAELEDRYS
ncbi:MAG: hypothetical protein NWS47_02375 [Alphaproteobacteria bacterium]|nr:hypothetical protein [Alphaproteobacteria bacterium]